MKIQKELKQIFLFKNRRMNAEKILLENTSLGYRCYAYSIKVYISRRIFRM